MTTVLKTLPPETTDTRNELIQSQKQQLVLQSETIFYLRKELENKQKTIDKLLENLSVCLHRDSLLRDEKILLLQNTDINSSTTANSSKSNLSLNEVKTTKNVITIDEQNNDTTVKSVKLVNKARNNEQIKTIPINNKPVKPNHVKSHEIPQQYTKSQHQNKFTKHQNDTKVTTKTNHNKSAEKRNFYCWG